MEENQTNPQTIHNVSQNPAKKGINIWKVLSIILLIVIIGLGAYKFGKNQTASQKTSIPQPSIVQTSASPTITQPTPTSAVTPIPSSKKVSAGIKNQVFSSYTVLVPSGWVDTHTNTTSDTLTITKGNYVLSISQAAGGAGGCDYPGNTPEPMAQVFSSFVSISGTFSQFRRGTTDNLTYTVCEQKSGGFAFPTSIGYATYKVPSQADQVTLSQMDGMVASIAK